MGFQCKLRALHVPLLEIVECLGTTTANEIQTMKDLTVYAMYSTRQLLVEFCVLSFGLENRLKFCS